MNRNDLEDLLDYDNSALSFGGVGLSLVSGAAFILVEQWFSLPGGKVTTLMQVCMFLIVIGAFLVWQGKKMHDKKRSRIERIFRETHEYQMLETPSQVSGPTNGFPPEADEMFDIVPDVEIAAWREKLNDRFSIGKGRLKVVDDPFAVG